MKAGVLTRYPACIDRVHPDQPERFETRGHTAHLRAAQVPIPGETVGTLFSYRTDEQHRNFYQMRLDRLRNAEKAKQSQQRVKDPVFFPAAPKGDPL